MAIEFSCPHCGKVLKTKDEKAGLSAKCPDCGGTVTVPSVSTGPDPWDGAVSVSAPSEGDNDVGAAADDAETGAAMKDCPMCGKSIRASARICRYCGERFARSADSKGIVPTRVGVSEALNTGVEIFKVHWLLLAVGFFITWIIPLVLGYAMAIPIAFLMMPGPGGAPPNMPLYFTLSFAQNVVQLSVSLFLLLGMNLFVLNVTRGREPQLGDLFQGGRYFLSALGSLLLLTLCSAPIVLLFMVPVFVVQAGDPDPDTIAITALGGMGVAMIPILAVYLRLSPFLVHVVDRNSGPIESLKAAWRITSGNMLTQFVVVYCMYFLCALGFLACCLPGFATMGLYHLLQAVTYTLMCGRQIRLVD